MIHITPASSGVFFPAKSGTPTTRAMSHRMRIRPAVSADAAAIASIYNHYILTTTISFEEDAVDAAEIARRMDAVQTASLPYLVTEEGGVVTGYAYATPWRARRAYRSSVETSVYVQDGLHAHGIGSALYRAVLAQLAHDGYHLAIGGIAQPNAASVALHEKLGFEKVAHFKEVGCKFGQWVDVAYWQLILNAGH
jgi:L-amino acid N-acyltransferase YncA